jgi:hypothetical protein
MRPTGDCKDALRRCCAHISEGMQSRKRAASASCHKPNLLTASLTCIFEASAFTFEEAISRREGDCGELRRAWSSSTGDGGVWICPKVEHVSGFVEDSAMSESELLARGADGAGSNCPAAGQHSSALIIMCCAGDAPDECG